MVARTRTAGRFAWWKESRWVSWVRQTAVEFFDDRVPRLGAALSYFTIFSLAPLLVLATVVASLLFEPAAVEARLVETFAGLLGAEGAEAIRTMLASAQRPGAGILAGTLGMVTLFVGAAAVFGQLQDALDTIWDVRRRKGRGIRGFLKDRFLSFTMVIGVGFLLVVSFILSAALSAAGDWMSRSLPGGDVFWSVANAIVALVVMWLLFAVLFKFVPNVKVAWRDVLLGAAVTALLFTLGETLVGLYLARSATVDAYGAAGSLAIVLLWVYYSSQIFFLGAEFTQVYANREGAGSSPDEDAVPMAERARSRRGMERAD